MKKLLCMLLSLCIIFSSASVMATIVSAEEQEEQYVNIPDPQLVETLMNVLVDENGALISDGKFTAEQLATLTSLEINMGNGVKNLEGLQYCTNLQSFIASRNPIESLEPLKDLKKLKEINIDNSGIEDAYKNNNKFDYDVLKDYKGIKDLSPLAGLTGLKTIVLNNHDISDISVLANLKSLSYIELAENNISDLSSLSGLSNLSTLYLNYNEIVDISPIANLTKLEELDLWENRIYDISALSNLTNLTYLDIENNYIGDPAPLSNLTKLYYGIFDANYFDLTEPSVMKVINSVVEVVEKRTGYDYFDDLLCDYSNQLNPVKVAKNLKGESDENGIKLTWTNSEQLPGRSVDLTQIFRYDANGKPVLIDTVEGDAASYVDTSAQIGESYTYSVRSCTKNEDIYVTSCMSDKATATREAAAAVVYGDIDSNGEVTSSDALTVLKASVGIIELTAEQEKAADVDGVDGVSSADALAILKYSVGIIDKFPVEG